MAPFLIALNSLITIGISSLFMLFLLLFKWKTSLLKSSIIYISIYIAVLLIYFKSNPFEFNKYLGDLDFWAFLSGIIAFFIFNIFVILRKKISK